MSVERTNALIKAEQLARLEWGGKRPYISKTNRADLERARERYRRKRERSG